MCRNTCAKRGETPEGLQLSHALFPKQCGHMCTHLGVLAVGVKQLMLRSLKRAACPANSLLFTVHSCLSKSSKCISDCAGSQNLGGGDECVSRLRSRCGAVRIFTHGGHFSWQAQGKPCVLVVQSRLFVTGASCFNPKCSFRGRCSTLDMVVAVEELRFRDRCSES